MATRTATHLPRLSRPHRGGLRTGPSGVMSLTFLAFGVYVLLPVFWLLVNATKSNADLFTSFGLWFGDSTQLLANIGKVLTYDGGIFLVWMRNTLLYSGFGALGAAVVCTLGGYAFAKYEFPGKNVVFWGIVVTIMVPNTALAIPLYQILSQVGLINSPLAVILPSMANPFGLYLMRVYVQQSVPDDLLAAGRVDGAGELRVLRRIALPVITPGLATVFLFVFVATWNNYFLPLLVLTDPGLQPVTVGLAGWNAQALASKVSDQVLYPMVITGSLLSVVPLVAAFLGLQRYWRSGLTVGSVR